jgi:hypothetical protein
LVQGKEEVVCLIACMLVQRNPKLRTLCAD